MSNVVERDPMGQIFMNAKETAKYLNMSVPWVYREAARAGLVPYRFGSGRNAKLQFKVAEVQAWVKQQRLPGD
ncbi:helix-turn-helix domain-containing protein [Streptomyces sp. SID2131]|nr:helix-turn-helix domain-containing protein [Streptomyces sp. SID2131]